MWSLFPLLGQTAFILHYCCLCWGYTSFTMHERAEWRIYDSFISVSHERIISSFMIRRNSLTRPVLSTCKQVNTRVFSVMPIACCSHYTILMLDSNSSMVLSLPLPKLGSPELNPLGPSLCLSSSESPPPPIGPVKLLSCLTCSYILIHFFSRGLLIALMMEAVSTSETLVNFCQTARHNIPEGCHLPFWLPFVSWLSILNIGSFCTFL
jgi:hypothetical protein